MPNPCGQVHMPSFPCRECDRVLAKQALMDSVPRLSAAEIEQMEKNYDATSERDVGPEAKDAEAVSDEGGEDVSRLDTGEPSSGQAVDGGSDASPSKPDRLAVAEEAVAETLQRYRAKNAARQKRYRERKRRQSDG